MFYYNKKSSWKVIHTKECFRICNQDINDIGWFETLDEAYEKGYRLCRHCSILRNEFNEQSKEIIDFPDTADKRSGTAVHHCRK